MPNWAKAAIEEWSKASGFSEELVFRAINKGDRVVGDGITPQAIYNIIVSYAVALEKKGVPRTTCGAHSLSSRTKGAHQ